MFDQFALGIYYPVESFLHRLRARTKLLVLGWLSVYVGVANQLDRVAPYAVLLALALLAALLSGVGLGHIWRRMRVLVLLTLLGTLPVLLLLESDGAPLAAIGPLVITWGALWLGLRLVVVFLALYALALLLTISTSPVGLIEGLTLLLGPLRRLRLPVDAFTLMALLALRFIPTLTDEIELLIKAQLARGADFSHGSLRERANSIAALMVPVYQGALRRAAELADALDARGYAIAQAPTMLHERPLAVADYLTLALVFMVTLGALLI
jgi:energy-coupling factor transport system permease protein